MLKTLENGRYFVGNTEIFQIKEEKSPSAKTITIKPAENGTEVKVDHESGDKKSADRKSKSPEGKKEGVDVDLDSEDLGEAATKIQAAFRGHQTRKSMKQGDKPANNAAAESEPTQEELEAEFRADDVELCQAATKIQASFRGHMSRKNKDKEDGGKDDLKNENTEEELDIDLSDPDLNKAAVKIQATFRGHMVRKDNEEQEWSRN